MRRGFSRDRRGRLRVRLEAYELSALTGLVAQLLTMVEPGPEPSDPLAAMVGIDPHARESDDPAVQRLFPAAYRDDDEAAAEFRRFTERSLRETKAQRARTVAADVARLSSSGGQGDVGEAEAQAWLGTLNDLRLVLATRLGVDDDENAWRERLLDTDDGANAMGLYDWLTWLQDGLVLTLMR